MIINFSEPLHDHLEINLAIMENILKYLKHAFLHFLGIKSNYQLYSLPNKSQEISNSKIN